MTVAIPEVAAAAGAESAAAGTTAEGAAGSSGSALRTPRAGGSAMAMDRKNRPPKPPPTARRPARPRAEEKPPEPPAGEHEDQADDVAEDRGPRRSLPNPGGAVREGSWVVLGFLAWVWVALPFIKQGPAGVGQVLAAKFVNRTPGTDHTPKGK